jgi:hypothetical protein
MTLTLKRLQAITNAPSCYDYGWMYTLVDNIAVDDKGRSCRLVENEDRWHFDQQILRYHSGLHLVITDQRTLDDFLKTGWLTLTENPIAIYRFKVDLQEAIDWERAQRAEIIDYLEEWQNGEDTTYTTGHGMTYLFECRGDEAAERVQAQLVEFGLSVERWGPQVLVESYRGHRQDDCCHTSRSQEATMTSRFCPITKDEMDHFLTGLGFMPLKLQGVVELVYGKIVQVGGHRLSLRCYTAINPGGESRERGTDAIRLQLFHRVQDRIVPVGRPQKCLRVESWRKNVRKAIQRITDTNNVRVCPACGNPLVVRRNRTTSQEFWGCCMFRITGCKGRTPLSRVRKETTRCKTESATALSK